MSIPEVTTLRLGPPGLPLLVLGPSLGTSAGSLWWACADLLDDFDILAWELPGHGTSSGTGDGFTMGELAAGVLAVVDDVLGERGEAGATFVYAGDSVGGAVGLQLMLEAPTRISAGVLLCTGAVIGTADAWHERAATVRASGTAVLVEASAGRWFAPGFLEREPGAGSALLHALRDTDREGYAQVCGALAGFDVRDRLAEVTVAVLAVAGAQDVATPPSSLREIADGVVNGEFVVLDDVAHLAPVEQPAEVARLIRAHVAKAEAATRTVAQVREAGMAVRREVLGDAHVDRATAAATDFTAEFQDFITQYAWGEIWTRPGLDRRSRSLITLTALVARGHHEELAMHVRAALTNGLSADEIKECLLQTAIYCGVPDANAAFRVAQAVLAEKR